MNAELLQSHWALLLASATGMVLLAVAVVHIVRRSARGQLRRMRRLLDKERGRYRKAAAVAARAERRESRLMEHPDRVKPRRVQEASEALQDAQALAKIAGDRVLVAENHLRRVILEEFPPTSHEKLRSHYLPDRPTGKRPFTF
jgi:hypothetical protein